MSDQYKESVPITFLDEQEKLKSLKKSEKRKIWLLIILFALSLFMIAICGLTAFIFLKNQVDPNSTVQWYFPAGGEVVSPALITEDAVYFGSLEGEATGPAFFAVNKGTGELIWTYRTNSHVFYWLPEMINGKVFFTSDDGYFTAVQAATGEKVWEFGPESRPIPEDPDCRWCALKFRTPSSQDGVIYLPSHDHNLYALDAETGKEQWRFTTNAGVTSTPFVDGDLLYFGSLDRNIYVLNTVDGSENYRINTSNGVHALLGDEDTIYALNGNLLAYDKTTGEAKWQAQPPNFDSFDNPALTDDLIIVTTTSAVYAYDKTSGKLVWRQDDLEGGIFSPISVADGNVFVGSAYAHLIILDSQSGKVKQKINMALHDLTSKNAFGNEFAFAPVAQGEDVYLGWYYRLYKITPDLLNTD